jgi:hypothetical protein
MELGPLTGDEVQALIAKTLATSPGAVKRAIEARN